MTYLLAACAGFIWATGFLAGAAWMSRRTRRPQPPQMLLCESMWHGNSASDRMHCAQPLGHGGDHKAMNKLGSIRTWDDTHKRAWDVPRLPQ